MLRDHFFVPAPPAIDLRAFTHGLMPRTVPTMMERFTEDWRMRGVDAWNEIPNHWRPDSGEAVGWWSLPTYLGDHFIAPLLDAPEGTCIMQPNVHWTVQCLLSCPEVRTRGQEILVTEAEFPSVLHSAQHWATMLGLRVRIVPQSADGFLDREAVLAGISAQTALIFLSHVGFASGERLEDAFLAEVAEKAHCYGALFALDGYHATGSLAVRVSATGADVYFGGLLKEACGSSGNAYVYIRPGLELTPALTGWFGDADPFGFHTGPHPHPEVRRRFLSGTTAVASLYHSVEGVGVLLKHGLARVEAHVRDLTERCIQQAEGAGLRLRSPREASRRGALVILDVARADLLSIYLKSEGIFTDSRRGQLLRLAPFVWNEAGEIDRTFDMISEALRDRRYLRASSEISTGPVT